MSSAINFMHELVIIAAHKYVCTYIDFHDLRMYMRTCIRMNCMHTNFHDLHIDFHDLHMYLHTYICMYCTHTNFHDLCIYVRTYIRTATFFMMYIHTYIPSHITSIHTFLTNHSV